MVQPSTIQSIIMLNVKLNFLGGFKQKKKMAGYISKIMFNQTNKEISPILFNIFDDNLKSLTNQYQVLLSEENGNIIQIIFLKLFLKEPFKENFIVHGKFQLKSNSIKLLNMYMLI